MRCRHRRSFSSIVLLLAFILGSVNAGNVTWISPSSGAVFGPGDIITGEWKTTQALSSPSFKLCTTSSASNGSKSDSSKSSDEEHDRLTDISAASGGSDTCGDSVKPSVTHDGQTYKVSL